MGNSTPDETLFADILSLAAMARSIQRDHLANAMLGMVFKLRRMQSELAAIGDAYITRVAPDSDAHRVQFGNGCIGVYADRRRASDAFVAAIGLYSKKEASDANAKA